MNLQTLIDRLAKFPAAFRAAATLVDVERARWKPLSGNWSILEICCHVRDEEREDFRPRLEATLGPPPVKWNLLDFDDVSTKRGYQQQDLLATLDEFASLRAANVVWLRSLRVTDADWERTYEDPKWGPKKAGALMSSWAAHDALHLRQVAKRVFELAAEDGGYGTAYAGEWS
jgi:hypothetical protein